MLCAATLGANDAAREMQAVSAPLDERSAAALVAEVRRSFTLQGKTIPPEIFRDFGDGDLAELEQYLGHRGRRRRNRQQSLLL